MGSSASTEDTEFCLKSFRLWASHAEIKRTDPLTAAPSVHAKGTESIAATWKAYYDILTAVLQKKLPYIPPYDGPSAKQLSSEFKRVQAITEVIFLANTKFPKANEGNEYVEAFVEQVIANWEILCGPEWNAEDFGEGGQDALSRAVLELLYRAAAKTFHSLVILRRLFHVHSSLSEFYLAMKALDTYITLHTRAKSRAQKHPNFMDSTETTENFARTVSEGVLMLSCFGTREDARRVKELVDLLEKQLEDLISSGASLSGISYTYRAIGIGLATWARWTPENEKRADIQAAALAALEKAASIETEGITDLAAAYALGLLLAETRDIDGAIECVRTALIKSKPADEEDDSNFNQALASRERDTIPLWHLFALLLSAKGDFDAAHRACVAGLDGVEAFPADISRQLWGDADVQSAVSSIEPKPTLHEVEAREKESIIELRLTQLSLIEALYGPEAALNHSDQLLRLFGRLFPQHEVKASAGTGPNSKAKSQTSSAQPQQQHLAPPHSLSEKPRVSSSRGSIFSRRKSSRKVETNGDSGSHHRFYNRASAANSIINAEHTHSQEEQKKPNGVVDDILHHHSNRASRDSKRAGEINVKLENGDEPASTFEKENGNTGRDPITAQLSEKGMPLPEPGEDNTPEDNRQLSVAVMGANVDMAAGIDPGKWPNQSVSPTGALITLTKSQSQKHICCVLAKIWLFIAGLFRRAELFDEAREACNEATEQAARLQSLYAAANASAQGLADPGWGLSKSADDLWADVSAERGQLAQAEGLLRDALRSYEESVQYNPTHLVGTIGLCNLLLDIYDEKFPVDDDEDGEEQGVRPSSSSSVNNNNNKKKERGVSNDKGLKDRPSIKVPEPYRKEYPTDEPSPKLTNRLAARDRASMLLSMLTKTGHAWDSSEAWYLLSRANEQTGDIGKTRDLLWWCIELEDKKPIRHWSSLGPGGYVL